MKCFLSFLLLTVLVDAQRPKPCETPPEWTGRQVSVNPEKKGSIFSRMSYDAIGERINLKEEADFGEELILLYREKTVFTITFGANRTETCVKEELQEEFHKFEIPYNATPIGRYTIGSNAFPFVGVNVEVFSGEIKGEPYVVSVTSEGCLPVFEVSGTKKYGPLHTRFYDIELGVDPERFVPPRVCEGKEE